MKTTKRGRPLGSKNKPKFEIEKITYESDCNKCDVHSPCAEHNIEFEDLTKQLSYGKEKPDLTFLYVFIIGLAVGVLFTHEYIIKCVDLIK